MNVEGSGDKPGDNLGERTLKGGERTLKGAERSRGRSSEPIPSLLKSHFHCQDSGGVWMWWRVAVWAKLVAKSHP